MPMTRFHIKNQAHANRFAKQFLSDDDLLPQTKIQPPTEKHLTLL